MYSKTMPVALFVEVTRISGQGMQMREKWESQEPDPKNAK